MLAAGRLQVLTQLFEQLLPRTCFHSGVCLSKIRLEDVMRVSMLFCRLVCVMRDVWQCLVLAYVSPGTGYGRLKGFQMHGLKVAEDSRGQRASLEFHNDGSISAEQETHRSCKNPMSFQATFFACLLPEYCKLISQRKVSVYF